jgi:hypothetical protein
MTGAELLATPIARFTVRQGAITECAERLRQLGLRVCSFEELPAEPGSPIDLRDQTLAGVLEAIVARHPSYRWQAVDDELINLFPRRSLLDAPLPEVSLRAVGSRRALEENLRIQSLGLSLFAEFGDPEGFTVDLELRGADLRAALNAMVRQHPPLVWQISGQPGAYFLSFSQVPQPASP